MPQHYGSTWNESYHKCWLWKFVTLLYINPVYAVNSMRHKKNYNTATTATSRTLLFHANCMDTGLTLTAGGCTKELLTNNPPNSQMNMMFSIHSILHASVRMLSNVFHYSVLSSTPDILALTLKTLVSLFPCDNDLWQRFFCLKRNGWEMCPSKDDIPQLNHRKHSYLHGDVCSPTAFSMGQLDSYSSTLTSHCTLSNTIFKHMKSKFNLNDT